MRPPDFRGRIDTQREVGISLGLCVGKFSPLKFLRKEFLANTLPVLNNQRAVVPKTFSSHN